MNRVYTVLHVLASIDGKISGAFFRDPKIKPVVKAFNEIRSAYQCRGYIYGSVTTASTYADKNALIIPQNDKKPNSQNLNKDTKEYDSYYFDVNPDGYDFWDNPTLTKREFKDTKIVEILTERTPEAVKSNLEEKGIDFFISGKDTFDPYYALEVIKKVYKIDRLMISGGGVLDWTFLEAGLIDEVSIVYAPFSDGSTDRASIFDRSKFSTSESVVSFERIDASFVEGGGIWTRYRPDNIRE